MEEIKRKIQELCDSHPNLIFMVLGGWNWPRNNYSFTSVSIACCFQICDLLDHVFRIENQWWWMKCVSWGVPCGATSLQLIGGQYKQASMITICATLKSRQTRYDARLLSFGCKHPSFIYSCTYQTRTNTHARTPCCENHGHKWCIFSRTTSVNLVPAHLEEPLCTRWAMSTANYSCSFPHLICT